MVLIVYTNIVVLGKIPIIFGPQASVEMQEMVLMVKFKGNFWGQIDLCI